ncbi:hypothetical protein FS749_009473 [Ceratobasidium sp. UAMH 11750]|nr:hypothetical protein FS749_009473 [Ceratobasidium sp. UAMH 11750]
MGPNLGHDKIFQASLGCNFTISFLGFCNQAHLDNDAFPYVFSIYIFVDDNGKLVTDRALIEECMEGGHFLWPDIHLGIDPSKSNGVVIFFWRGTHEQHCTIETKVYPETGVRRYGTSIQVNKRLLNETIKYHQAFAEYQVELELWEVHGRDGPKPVAPIQPTGLDIWA